MDPCHSQGGLYSGPYAHEAVRRYETIWIPIILSLPEDQLHCLTPPLDVAYAWLVSLLPDKSVPLSVRVRRLHHIIHSLPLSFLIRILPFKRFTA